MSSILCTGCGKPIETKEELFTLVWRSLPKPYHKSCVAETAMKIKAKGGEVTSIASKEFKMRSIFIALGTLAITAIVFFAVKFWDFTITLPGYVVLVLFWLVLIYVIFLRLYSYFKFENKF